MKSRKHDVLIEMLLNGVTDFSDKEYAETLRTAVEKILSCTREEAYAACNSNTVWEMWPEDDATGLRYKTNQILTLMQSRPATGAVEDFLTGTYALMPTKYVKVVEWGTEISYSGSRKSQKTSKTSFYHIDDLPERFKDWPIPCSKGDTALMRLYAHGIGD